MFSAKAFKIVMLVVILLGGGFSSSATAALIAPGGTLFPAPGEPDPVGGTVLQTLTSPVVALDFTGVLTTRVLAGDTSNPFGGLTFTYQFTNTDTGPPTDVNRITGLNYTGFQTDASWQIGTGLNPTLINRGLPPAGAEIGFDFLDSLGQGGVRPGQTTAVLVVQTNATMWVPSAASVINGGAATVPSLGPAVPEPASLGLLAGAVLLLIRRK